MVEFSNKKLAYAAIGTGLFGTLVALTQGGGLFSLIGGISALIGSAVGIIMLKYGYLVVPWFTKRGNIITIIDEDYEIPPSQDVIVKRGANGLYYATVFLGIRIYQSAIEMSEEQIHAYNQFFERAMVSFKKIVKIAYMMHALDISQKKKEYEEKRAEAQLRLQREREKAEPDVLKIQRYEKEIAYYSAQLDRLVRGERPMRVVAYAMHTAVGLTKEEAISKAKANGRELKSVIANALNVDVDFLQADEMLKIFEWEKFMPATPEELEEMAELKVRGR